MMMMMMMMMTRMRTMKMTVYNKDGGDSLEGELHNNQPDDEDDKDDDDDDDRMRMRTRTIRGRRGQGRGWGNTTIKSRYFAASDRTRPDLRSGSRK